MKKLPVAIFLIGLLIAITWLNYLTDSKKSNGTPLREYRLMLEDQQKLTILESRRVLFHEYLEYRDIDRASCVAQLFVADTDKGKEQFIEVIAFIEKEINRDVNQMTENVVNKFIKTNYCPPTDIR